MLMFLGVTLQFLCFIIHMLHNYVTDIFTVNGTNSFLEFDVWICIKYSLRLQAEIPLPLTSPPPLQMRDPNSQLASPGEQEPARHCG
jgi:hypothetical protein